MSAGMTIKVPKVPKRPTRRAVFPASGALVKSWLAGKRVEPGDLLVLEYRRGVPTGRVKKAPKRRGRQPVIGVAMRCEDGGSLVTVSL